MFPPEAGEGYSNEESIIYALVVLLSAISKGLAPLERNRASIVANSIRPWVSISEALEGVGAASSTIDWWNVIANAFKVLKPNTTPLAPSSIRNYLRPFRTRNSSSGAGSNSTGSTNSSSGRRKLINITSYNSAPAFIEDKASFILLKDGWMIKKEGFVIGA